MLQALNHITLAVSDVSRSFNFYVNTPGFTPATKWARAENIPTTRWNFSNIRSGFITRVFLKYTSRRVLPWIRSLLLFSFVPVADMRCHS